MQKLTKAAFLDVYPAVRKIIGDYFVKQLPSCPQRTVEWVEKVRDPAMAEVYQPYVIWFQVLDYNVPGGKLKRGLTVVHAFQSLKPEASESDTNVAVRLGWALEIVSQSAMRSLSRY